MTDTAKPTRGPWNVFERRPAGYLCGYNVGGDGDVPVAACNFGDTANKANADFIADAGTVYHETGLTPRQLLERVRELEADIAEIVKWGQPIIDMIRAGESDSIRDPWISGLETALGKHREDV
jgi:hypothetical protein